MNIKLLVFTVLSSTLILSTNLAAEPFNDRGTYWLRAASSGSDASYPPVDPSIEGFKNRGTNWIVVAPAGSDTSREPVNPTPSGFNDKNNFEDLRY